MLLHNNLLRMLRRIPDLPGTSVEPRPVPVAAKPKPKKAPNTCHEPEAFEP